MGLNDIRVLKKHPPIPCMVTLSGGGDSVYLLNSISRYNCKNIMIFHVNHNLQADAVFFEDMTRKIALKKGIVLKVAFQNAQSVQNESVEDQARNIRYILFFRILSYFSFRSVFIAHHLFDSIESFFLEKQRGALAKTFDGMISFWVCKKTLFYRPLIFLYSEVIKKELAFRSVDWIDDFSNFDARIFRGDFRKSFLQNKLGFCY